MTVKKTVKNFIKLVKDTRIQENMSQDCLAKRLHVTRATVIALEKGRVPKLDRAIKIAKLLKIQLGI